MVHALKTILYVAVGVMVYNLLKKFFPTVVP